MKNFLFSLESVATMLVECYRRGSICETGGILVGPVGVEGLVTEAIVSSSFAERGELTYCQNDSDVRFLNHSLREYQKCGKDFLGYFHRHPSGLTGLSSGDLRTCREILENPDYKINNRLLMVIITENSSNDISLPIFSYVVSIEGSELVVRRTPVEVMPKKCMESFGRVMASNNEEVLRSEVKDGKSSDPEQRVAGIDIIC